MAVTPMNSPGILVFTSPRIFLACLVGEAVAEALLPTAFAPFDIILGRFE
jgi:hypothetical protein